MDDLQVVSYTMVTEGDWVFRMFFKWEFAMWPQFRKMPDLQNVILCSSFVTVDAAVVTNSSDLSSVPPWGSWSWRSTVIMVRIYSGQALPFCLPHLSTLYGWANKNENDSVTEWLGCWMRQYVPPPPIYIVFSAKWSASAEWFWKGENKTILIKYTDQCAAGQRWRLLLILYSLHVFLKLCLCLDLFVLHNQ